MEKERDTFDDLFRSKLQDFEVDTMPGDWEAIADRLPQKAPIPFRRTLRYWAAAAVVSLLMITSGVYLFKSDKGTTPIADKIEKETKKVETELAKEIAEPTALVKPVEEQVASQPVAVVQQPIVNKTIRKTNKAAFEAAVTEPAVISSDVDLEERAEVITLSDGDSVVVDKEDVEQDHPEVGSINTRSLVADASPVGKKKKEASPRKWGFGMGGGSVTTGTSNSLNTFALKNTMMTDQELLFLNSANFENTQPKTNIHHKTPISVGLSVSRYLNNRFSLMMGLNYSFLSSSWEIDAMYHNETTQKLHFIGIPVSLSYKIAEWNRFQFYAAAGVMTEVNVAGKLATKKYSGKDLYEKEYDHTRMKEWLWSVNARAGVSYPLLRFVSLYAEVGADYYFDNGSTIETIHSEKPFNVSLQAGFRFGF